MEWPSLRLREGCEHLIRGWAGRAGVVCASHRYFCTGIKESTHPGAGQGWPPGACVPSRRGTSALVCRTCGPASAAPDSAKAALPIPTHIPPAGPGTDNLRHSTHPAGASSRTARKVAIDVH